ncbi:MAG: nitroreductase family protein [Candidatus Caldarchaeum sp.]|uniref:Nitroreductase domain-containing protein n=1 Tax=Caldiarchaeum subterraneum TaxID=311458 RepID=A0A7C5QE54_CALS0
MKRRVEHSTLGLLLSRRSIRRFRKTAMGEDVLSMIVEAGQSAPAYLQAYSIIWVRDENLVEMVASICESEPIRQASAVLLVCLDFNRLAAFLQSVVPDNFLKLDAYPAEVLLSVLETGLVVENMIIASEALGYGSLLLDCGVMECERLVDVFKLPHGVVPLVILLIGEKEENPPPRPRWSIKNILHINSYKPVSQADVGEYLRTVEKTLSAEGYLVKYAKFAGSYAEYLAERMMVTKDIKQSYEQLSAYLRKRGVKV